MRNNPAMSKNLCWVELSRFSSPRGRYKPLRGVTRRGTLTGRNAGRFVTSAAGWSWSSSVSSHYPSTVRDSSHPLLPTSHLPIRLVSIAGILLLHGRFSPLQHPSSGRMSVASVSVTRTTIFLVNASSQVFGWMAVTSTSAHAFSKAHGVTRR